MSTHIYILELKRNCKWELYTKISDQISQVFNTKKVTGWPHFDETQWLTVKLVQCTLCNFPTFYSCNSYVWCLLTPFSSTCSDSVSFPPGPPWSPRREFSVSFCPSHSQPRVPALESVILGFSTGWDTKIFLAPEPVTGGEESCCHC